MERLKNHYFVLVRLFLMVTFCAYGFVERPENTQVSAWVLFLMAMYLASMCIFEIVPRKYRFILLIMASGFFSALMALGETGFMLLGFVIVYDFLSLF